MMNDKKHRGFTLFEALIALSVAAIIVLACSQLVANLTKLSGLLLGRYARTVKMMRVESQLEKDLSLIVAYKNEQKREQKADQNQQDKSASLKQEELIARTLIAQLFDDEQISLQKNIYKRLKLLNAVTTHPFNVYGRKNPTLTRISYKLIKHQLDRPFNKINAFKLYRKETFNLDDLNLKNESLITEASLGSHQDWVLIVDNIAECALRFAVKTSDPEKRKQEPFQYFFAWPPPHYSEEQKVVALPDAFEIVLYMWNEDYTDTYKYYYFIPCYSAAATQQKHLAANALNHDAQKQKTLDTSLAQGDQKPDRPLETISSSSEKSLELVVSGMTQ